MTGKAFLTPSLSLLLDLVRGIAALVVLVGHAQGMELYTGPYPLSPYIQHHAVIVFFVLSGLVIAHSVQQRQGDLAEYAIARIARIVPVALFAIAVSAALFAWTRLSGLDAGMPGPYDTLSWQTTLLPALFLSESAIGQGLVWNPPYWSLVCEMFFYAFFGAAVFLCGGQRMLVLGFLALLAGWKVLALFPIWLLGVALVRWPERFTVGRIGASAALVAALAVALIVDRQTVPLAFALAEWTGLSLEGLGIAKYLLADVAMGVAVTLAFVGMRAWSDAAMPLLARGAGAIHWLAGISFTLYVVHHPILLTLRAYGIGAGDSPVIFAGTMAFVVAISWLLADLVEHRTPALRRAMRNWLAARQPHLA